MLAFTILVIMITGITFITTFALIMHCRSLGIDPTLEGFAKDIDIVFTCKISGIAFAIALGIFCELTAAHPLIHLSL